MKQTTHILYLIFALCMLPLVAYPQKHVRSSEKMKPDWLTSKLPKPGNNSFSYIITQAEGVTLDEARSKSFKEAINYIDRNNNIQVSGDIVSRASSTQKGSDYTETLSDEYIYTYKIESENVKVRLKKVDEYWEIFQLANGSLNYHSYNLYAVGTDASNVKFDDVSFSSKYKWDGLWRSLLIPGYGQIYKGSIGKGSAIIAGEVLLVSGIIFTENSRSSYRRKTKETYDVAKIINYTDKADNYETARNVCIGAAAALYIYNLIDVVATDGRKRIRQDRRYTLNPVASPELSGLSLAINF